MKQATKNANYGQQRPLHTMRHRRAALAVGCIIALCASGLARADAVTDWNTVANQNTPLPLPAKLRALAMVQIAVHDALNYIDPRYETYTVQHATNPHALPDIAVASAAYHVLKSVAPASQQAAIAAEYADALNASPDCHGPAKARCKSAIAAGKIAATAIVHQRRGDHSEASNYHRPYTLAPAPGVHQQTPDTVPTFPAFAGWATVTPFAMTSGDQFRAPPNAILDVTSFDYAIEYLKVWMTGSKLIRAAAPDSEPSKIARFWYGSAGVDWAGLGQAVVQDRGLDRWEHARLFALLAIGQADVVISVFDSKYHYNFWRPVTAIRQDQPGQDDGNFFTMEDASWTPYLVTPPYPDYPCGTPMLAGAGTEVLRDFLGADAVSWTATSNFPGQPDVPAGAVTRSYASLSEAADEAAVSRMYAGIHFEAGCHVGVDLGEQLGRYTFDNYLRPLD